MPADPAKKRATYEDLLQVPDHQVAEIIDGELYTQPRPAGPHAHVASVLGMDVGSPFHRARGGPGGWIILDEPELHLDQDIVVPDLAGWRRDRMAEVPAQPFFDLAPDWTCEVLSPSTALLDRRSKLPLYAQAGVAHLWLVDPIARSVEVFILDQDSYRLAMVHGENEVVRLPPFDAIELSLEALWTTTQT
jgi:Uma2 family endonuclease